MVVISLIRLWMGQVFRHIWMLVKCRTSHSRHMYPSRICRNDVVHGQESPSIVRRKDAPSQEIQSILDELKEAFAGFFVFVVFGSDFFFIVLFFRFFRELSVIPVLRRRPESRGVKRSECFRLKVLRSSLRQLSRGRGCTREHRRQGRR